MNIFKKIVVWKKPPETFVVEEEDHITDEIEKSLWDLKFALDLPTEEIERAVLSRKASRSKDT